MRRGALLVAALAPLLCGFGVLEGRNADVEQGNAALKAGKAEEALSHYDKAVAKLPADAGAHFDRGTALYALSRFDEAGQEFLRATQAPDPTLKASAFFNLGNAFLKKEKVKEAIEAYKRTLTLRPDDQAAKWNLEIALAKKKEEEKKKQDKKDEDDKKDEKKDDKKDQDKKDEKKDDKKDQDKKDEKKDDKKDQDKKDEKKDDKKDQDKKDEKKDQAPQKPQPQKPSSAEQQQIEAVLDNLERSSKDLEKERARIRAVRRAPPTKDW